ncbi:hypothetical protein CYMTET_45363 [Cymbomonas tetramitiformis]|uniref:Uncharacterized protein n=1 Tax=Cymbomonas tetramitiformis TaxID=36881 RepID=A0AAE0EZS0_9CHLO|nr:hypothetical protein CYMTET_45363 [Cymbomonas tetramitiformis]
MVVQLRTEFASAGLELASFDLDEPMALVPVVQRQRDPPQRQHGQRPPQGRQPQRQGQPQRGFRMGVNNPPAVGFDRDEQRAKPLCNRCKKSGKELYHFYRDCPLGGRQHSPGTAAAFCIPIDDEDAEGVHALAMCAVFQEAADEGADAFARAATVYGPPAVLCGGVVGGIDVSAYGFSVDAVPPVTGTPGEDILQRLDDLAAEVNAAVEPKVHYTHASFLPSGGVDTQASALVCDSAEAGDTPEKQVPAGGAAASASAVPAPAMPVLEDEEELLKLYGYGEPVSLQSARVTTTASTDGEFKGIVENVDRAAVMPVDLTGYDTDDYEDLPDGSFRLRPQAVLADHARQPRAPAILANHASEPAAHAPPSGGAVGDWCDGAHRTSGCGKPPWGFPAQPDRMWGMPFLLSFILSISVMGVGAATFTVANETDLLQVSDEEAPLGTVPCAIPPRLHRREQRRQGLYMAPVPWHPGPPPPAVLFEDGPPLSPASSSDDEAPPSGSTWQHPGAVQPPVIDESTTTAPSNSLANDFSLIDTLHFGRPVLLRRATAGYYGDRCGEGVPLNFDPE